MDSVLGLQVGSVAALNAAFAWLVGSWLARRWLLAAGSPRSDAEALLRSGDIAAAALGVLGTSAMVWVSAAVMGGVGLQEAKDVVWQMLTMTSIGRAGYISFFAICLVLVLRLIHSAAQWREWAVLAALSLFAFVRASMGHAGENGFWTLPFAVEVVHLTAMGAWTGLVAVSAWKTVATHANGPDLNRMSHYLESMSAAAMIAVIRTILRLARLTRRIRLVRLALVGLARLAIPLVLVRIAHRNSLAQGPCSDSTYYDRQVV